MLSIRISQPESLAALGQQWQHLETRADCSFFQSWDWVGCLAEERYDDPVLIETRRGDETVALALFNRRRFRIGGDRLWLGETGRPAWDSVFIEHNGVLAVREETAAARQCLDAALGRARRGVVLSGIGETDLAAALGSSGVCTARQTRIAPFVDIAAIQSDYLAQLSANTRQQLRRSARRYEQVGELQVTRAGSAAEATRFLEELAVLHQKSWTRRGQPGAFARPEFVRFHQALIARSDAVDLLRITAGEQVIGYLYNFRFRGCVLAYQSGFDYAGAAPQAKPGMTCHHLAIERYIAEGMGVYDFLAGDDRYKRSLATGARPLHWMTMAPKWSFAGLLASLVRSRPHAPAPNE